MISFRGRSRKEGREEREGEEDKERQCRERERGEKWKRKRKGGRSPTTQSHSGIPKLGVAFSCAPEDDVIC